jgi:hypothetical protein
VAGVHDKLYVDDAYALANRDQHRPFHDVLRRGFAGKDIGTYGYGGSFSTVHSTSPRMPMPTAIPRARRGSSESSTNRFGALLLALGVSRFLRPRQPSSRQAFRRNGLIDPRNHILQRHTPERPPNGRRLKKATADVRPQSPVRSRRRAGRTSFGVFIRKSAETGCSQ